MATFISLIARVTALSSPGEGPTLLGQTLSVAQTIQSLTRGQFSQYFAGYQESEHPIQTLVKTPGRQINNAAVKSICGTLNRFIKRHSSEKAFTLVEAFLNAPQDTLPLAEFLDTFAEGLSLPLYAPFTLDNHIVVIYIKDSTLFYYDPKGMISDKRILGPEGDKSTLRTYLESLQEYLSLEEIHENTTMHQLDCHHCGAFICLYILTTALLSIDQRQFSQNIVMNSMMEEFRSALADEMVVGAFSAEHAFEARFPKTFAFLTSSPLIQG